MSLKMGKYRVKDMVNPYRWWVTIKYYLHRWTSPIPDSHEEIVAYSEQIVYRRIQCPACVEKGECLRCGCPVNGLMTNPHEVDKDHLWGKMMRYKEWEKFKKDQKIEFQLIYKT